MASNLEKGNRFFDIMHRTNSDLLDILSATIGVPIGQHETGILYIQDNGVKLKGHCYIDKVSGRLFLCTNNTSSTSNTSDLFEDYNLVRIINQVKSEAPYMQILYDNRSMQETVSNGQTIQTSDDIKKYDLLLWEFHHDSIYYHVVTYGRECTQNGNMSNVYATTPTFSSGGLFFDFKPHADGRSIIVSNNKFQKLRVLYGFKILK